MAKATTMMTGLLALLLGGYGPLAAPSKAQAGPRTSVSCKILENGKSANGTFVLERAGKTVVEGTCDGVPIPAAPGQYTARLRLDGALDAPERRQTLTLAPGANDTLRADFATGELRVAILRDGRPAAGMVLIRRDGKSVGTLASGVSGHLSAGTYQVTARYRASEKPLGDVVVKAGKETRLEADFE